MLWAYFTSIFCWRHCKVVPFILSPHCKNVILGNMNAFKVIFANVDQTCSNVKSNIFWSKSVRILAQYQIQSRSVSLWNLNWMPLLGRTDAKLQSYFYWRTDRVACQSSHFKIDSSGGSKLLHFNKDNLFYSTNK